MSTDPNPLGVPARRHANPDGSVGGWVADTATVSRDARVSGDARHGETGLHYGESLWLTDDPTSGEFDRYTVAEFHPEGTGDGVPVVILHADGDPRWPLTLDIGSLTRRGWYCRCPWPGCNVLVESSLTGRFDHRCLTDGRLLCAEHSGETREIDYDAQEALS